MSNDSIISLLAGIPIGIISGLYTGLIVTRYARFAELRNEALRIIRTMDFVHEDSKILVSHDQEVSKLALIASDLLFLRHRAAGEQVNGLSKDISDTNLAAGAGRITFDKYQGCYARWQTIARSLSPNKFVIVSLWGKL